MEICCMQWWTENSTIIVVYGYLVENEVIIVVYRESFMPIPSGLLPNLPPIFARFTSYNSSGIPLILSRSLWGETLG